MKKIKVFDAHTDILYDCYQSSLKGDISRFNDYHYNQLNHHITGGIWTVYSPNEFNLFEALEVSKSLVDLDQFEVILGIEGLRNLKDVSELERIYQLGYRHAMLTWNEANQYATGVNGPKDQGLTQHGYEVLDFMIENDMIIDLSHLNEKSFYDVLNYTSKNILVSHSNLAKLMDHKRNLTDDQLKKLKEANGLLCLTAVGNFIAIDESDKNLDTWMKHLEEAIKIMGIDNVGFGFDFMDYFGPTKTMNLEELKNASEVGALLKKLAENGYSKEDIEKLTYYNIYNRFSRHIYKQSNQ